jgi:hypothetical protein
LLDGLVAAMASFVPQAWYRVRLAVLFSYARVHANRALSLLRLTVLKVLTVLAAFSVLYCVL